MGKIRERLTYANVMVTVLTFVVLGGGAWAARSVPKNSVRTKSVRNGAITNPKLANGAVTSAKVGDGSLTGGDIDLGTLGQVPSAQSAADAQHAGNADQLGGVAASGYQARIRWAIVNASGTITAQSGGITNDAHPPIGCPTGCDLLNFGSSQVGKAIIATPNYQLATLGNLQSPVVGLCGGGNPGGLSCSGTGFDDTSHVFVQNRDAAGAAADRPYYIAVIG